MRTIFLVDLGARIAQARGSRSRPVFAREMGVHKNTLVNYESGDTAVSAEFVAGLVKSGYNAHWLLTGEGQMRIEEMPAAQPGAAAEPRELLVAQVAKTVDYALDDLNLELDLDKKWELIELIADMEADTGSHMDRKHVVRLVRSAA